MYKIFEKIEGILQQKAQLKCQRLDTNRLKILYIKLRFSTFSYGMVGVTTIEMVTFKSNEIIYKKHTLQHHRATKTTQICLPFR